VDRLPERQAPVVCQFIEELQSGEDDAIAAGTLAAIQEGLEDIKAGRTISLEELERKYGWEVFRRLPRD
jgi:predicted transcriptional regulator